MKIRTAVRGDQRIEYDDSGEGDLTLLGLPGWCVQRTIFAKLAERLRGKHRMIALDWSGHGGSSKPAGDFGESDLVQDALAVVEQSGAKQVVLVAQAHAGWIALELRRRLGARVAAVVCTSWMLGDPPPPFFAALTALGDREHWQGTRDKLLGMWLAGAPQDVADYVRAEMTSHGFEMWSRAGREIATAFAREGSAVGAFDRLEPTVRVLHLFAQPRDPIYLAAQRSLARERSWLSVEHIDATSHFPTLEVPDLTAAAIERFLKNS